MEGRDTFIGASEIPRIAGLVPGHEGEALQIYLRKIGETQDFWTPGERFRLDSGTATEAVVARYLAEVNGWSLEECDTIRHPLFSWAAATPDRKIVDSREIIEIKNVGINSAHWWDGGPPEHVQAQAQWQMACTTSALCYVAATIGGAVPQTWKVYADPDIQAELLRIGQNFWENHVVKRVPPAIDGSIDTTAWLSAKFARANGASIECPSAVEYARVYAECRAEIKKLEAKKSEAGNKLRALLGEASKVTFDGGCASWTEQHGAVDWKKICTELNVHPDVQERYRKPGARILRVRYGVDDE
jgi:putative phage-type endonuclease